MRRRDHALLRGERRDARLRRWRLSKLHRGSQYVTSCLYVTADDVLGYCVTLSVCTCLVLLVFFFYLMFKVDFVKFVITQINQFISRVFYLCLNDTSHILELLEVYLVDTKSRAKNVRHAQGHVYHVCTLWMSRHLRHFLLLREDITVRCPLLSRPHHRP